jgi:L-asparaginase
MNLSLIYTGGTIGSAGEPLNPLPATEFDVLWQRHVAPNLDPELALDWQWLEPALDSNDIVPSDWGRLARMVLETGDSDAAVLLHGTDTMAWTAAALAYC